MKLALDTVGMEDMDSVVDTGDMVDMAAMVVDMEAMVEDMVVDMADMVVDMEDMVADMDIIRFKSFT